MIVTAERPTTVIVPRPRLEADGAAARALALAFLRYASACWRGDESARRFAAQLGVYWRPRLAAAPAKAPDAFSPHGAGGRGIAWFQTHDAVLGAIPECNGGYVVPLAAIPRLVRCVADAAGEERPRDLMTARGIGCRGAAA